MPAWASRFLPLLGSEVPLRTLGSVGADVGNDRQSLRGSLPGQTAVRGSEVVGRWSHSDTASACHPGLEEAVVVRRRLSRVVMGLVATLGLTFGATPALGADGDL